MSTEKEPDYAGIAQTLASKKYPSEQMPGFDGVVSYGPSWRNSYASCMESRLRSDWETIRLLKMAYWSFTSDVRPRVDAHISKLLELFT